MATKEFREFFLRINQVNTGSKPDKETGFPTQYQIVDSEGNPITVYNRFLKNNVPSEAVYKKLFESIAFKLNVEDTATTSNVGHGLVRIAIGENVINGLDSENGFTTVIVPSTLPRVSGAHITPLIRRVADNVIVSSITPGDRGLYYIDYRINDPNIQYVSLIDTTTVNQGGLTPSLTGCFLDSLNIPADKLNNDGDSIEFEIIIDKVASGPSSVTEALALKLENNSTEYDGVNILPGAGWDPNLAEQALHVHAKGTIYRRTGTTLHIISNVSMFKRNSATYGESRFSNTGVSHAEQAWQIQTRVHAVDFTQDLNLNLYFNVLPTNVNAHTPLIIQSYFKTLIK